MITNPNPTEEFQSTSEPSDANCSSAPINVDHDDNLTDKVIPDDNPKLPCTSNTTEQKEEPVIETSAPAASSTTSADQSSSQTKAPSISKKPESTVEPSVNKTDHSSPSNVANVLTKPPRATPPSYESPDSSTQRNSAKSRSTMNDACLTAERNSAKSRSSVNDTSSKAQENSAKPSSTVNDADFTSQRNSAKSRSKMKNNERLLDLGPGYDYQPSFLCGPRPESATATMEWSREEPLRQFSIKAEKEAYDDAARRSRYVGLQQAKEDEDHRKEALLMRIKALDDELNGPEPVIPSEVKMNAAVQKVKKEENHGKKEKIAPNLPPVSMPPGRTASDRERQLLLELFGDKALSKEKPPKPREEMKRTAMPWEIVVDLERERENH